MRRNWPIWVCRESGGPISGSSRRFTPRHDTVIVSSLATLNDAQGKDAFIRRILSANDEETANFFQYMAETMRGYQETVSPIMDIKVVSGLVFAKAKDGSVLIPLPVDYGIWTRAGGPNHQRRYQVLRGLESGFFREISPMGDRNRDAAGARATGAAGRQGYRTCL